MEDKKQDKDETKTDSERTKQVTVAGWTAGVAAVVMVWSLTANASWPMAVAMIAIAAMVAVACYFMLKQP